MSHEIRTPLNGVIGMLDLLAGSELNDRQNRYARVAKSSADSLLSVINQILDFSKIEAGKVELETLDFDPRLLVEDTLEMFVKRAHEKGLELACQTSPDVPATVRGDQDRLRQVLVNLINNALKFTEHGEIVVRTNCDAESTSEARLRFSVQDTGVGIPPERRSQLFQSFSQLDASTTRRYGGTGLGLCISKGLVELMGGEIGVESRPGEGSTFWCSIPFHKHGGRRKAQQVPDDLRRLRVLAVDDNATNLEVLHEQFQSWGLALTTASDGRTALHLLERAAEIGHPFDLAMLDVQMPVMDGLELARHIKNDPATSETLLIVLTSMGQDLSPVEMQQHGLAGYIHKPVRQSRLLDAIVDVTSHEVLMQAADLDASTGPTPSVQHRGRVLVAEDNDVNQVVVTEILSLAGFDCDVVASGRAAVQRALSGNFDLVLMDCQMPEMDGFAAAQLIRKTEAERSLETGASDRVPIVALTANAVKGDRQRCLDAGMDAYLSKPVDATALLEIMETLLVQYDRVGEPPAGMTEAKTADLSAIGFDELIERCVNNRLVAARVLEKFSDSAPQQLQRIHAALHEGAVNEVARVAHLLRGMAASVSATCVAELAAVLENSAIAGDCSGIDLEEFRRAIDDARRAAATWIEELRCSEARSTIG